MNLTPEHFIHAAMHSNNNETAAKNDARTAEVDEAYENARSQDGLGSLDLGLRSILNNTNAVIGGFFTSFVATQLSDVLNTSKTWQLALISLSVTWIVLSVEKLYLYTLGKASWIMARTWSKIFRQFLRFFTLLMVFLTTNFVVAVFTQQVSLAKMQYTESLALIYVCILLLFYYVNAFDSLYL